MNIFINIFNAIFAIPLTNVLVAFYQLFYHLGIPFAFGLSIIALSIVIKLILWPLMTAQIKSQHKMQKVAPHLSALKELHKGDAKKLQEESMRLYKEHGVNPAGGCLPALVQLPFIYGLYTVLISAVNVSGAKDIARINSELYFPFLKLDSVWDTTMFGLSLGKSPQHLMSVAPLIVLVPAITVGFQFFLSKMMMPDEELVPATTTAPKKEDDFQAAFQKQSLFMFPLVVGFFSFTLPLGLSLYWNTFSIFGIIQQYIIIGPGAARPWFDKVKKGKKKDVAQPKVEVAIEAQKKKKKKAKRRGR